MLKKLLIYHLFLLCFVVSYAQSRWQQKVKYVMDVRLDVKTNKLTGKQQLHYTNHSPDTLDQLFYHLYWNAFQPGSMMDVRSRELGKITRGNRRDWDPRVKDRILNLKNDEIGYQKVMKLSINGVAQEWKEQETILQVKLKKPILPSQTVIIDLEFEAQVPMQIRRSGRDAANGVRYSMTQWYPKICEYDIDGWHPNPYIAREFYGVWGDFQVNITIDSSYIIGGTGYLQNAQQIGYGYEKTGIKVVRSAGKNLTWKFYAPNVHDFAWAADPDFVHLTKTIQNGPEIHVLYKHKPGDTKNDSAWKNVINAANLVYPFIRNNFGAYPYKQYTFIQGGDGGMEYPMTTLINGPSLGTVFHEWLHSWYQMMMATNESLHAWMDEGFTEFATDLVEHFYQSQISKEKGIINTDDKLPLYHSGNYDSYFYLVKSGTEEPLTPHADHYNTNAAYSIASYSKGCVYLAQLGYIMGEKKRDELLLEYYKKWRFRHPRPSDFIRLAEQVSGMQLDWYNEYWVNSTKTIDYAIDSLWEESGETFIRIKRKNEMPMPIDVQLTFKDNKKENHYIPMYLMFGEKPTEDTIPRSVHAPWKWTDPLFVFKCNRKLTDIISIEIDPSQRMADVDRKNNKLEIKW
ncbi:MAG: M1 family metallopeptidase [Bacteroidota bacterium]